MLSVTSPEPGALLSLPSECGRLFVSAGGTQAGDPPLRPARFAPTRGLLSSGPGSAVDGAAAGAASPPPPPPPPRGRGDRPHRPRPRPHRPGPCRPLPASRTMPRAAGVHSCGVRGHGAGCTRLGHLEILLFTQKRLRAAAALDPADAPPASPLLLLVPQRLGRLAPPHISSRTPRCKGREILPDAPKFSS